ncbi:MAG: stalk domain-containing protein, partial [Lachnospirales bacterium]
TKIELLLNQVFSFVGVPKLECSGKFEGACSIAIDKNNSQKAIITLTKNINTGTTGTIKISDIFIERSKNATSSFKNVDMTITSSVWKDTTYVCNVANYKEGANEAPPLILKSSAVSAKKYSQPFNFTITNSGRTFKAGTKIKLSFDNNYVVFTKGNKAKISGKDGFENNCQLVYENESAYILIPNDVQGSGTISVNGIVIEKKDEEEFTGNVIMSAEVEGDSGSKQSVAVAKYSSIYDTVPQTTTEATTEATTVSSENNTSGKVVKFVIGDKTYSINGEESELLASPYIKEGYTMLPMRAIANICGISDDKISFLEGTATFVIANGIELKVTAGSDKYTVGDKSINSSTSAEIVNGTMFLPMRDLANAIGISNDKISFDGEKKEVTLNI